MSSSVAHYTTVLKDLTHNKLDDETVDYVAGMLYDEGASSLNEETVSSLVGPFLLDSGVCATDAEVATICQRLSVLCVGEPQPVSGTAPGCRNQELHVAKDKCSNGFSRPPFNVEDFMNNEGGFNDPYLGLRKVNVNFNSSLPLSDALKLQAELKRKKEKQMKLMREWERTKAPLPPPIKRTGNKQLSKITDILIDSFSVIVGGRELLKDATLKIVIGRKYGLIGRNGIGKSTFISSLVRHELPGLQKDLNIGCVEQELSAEDLKEKVIDAVLAVHVERAELLQLEKMLLQSQTQTEETGKRLAEVYQRMEEIDANVAEAEAASILSGLGFSLKMQQMRIQELSGGWRVRVALARALFATPDILCLDEPTNHLDLHAVAWLTDFLQASPITCIIVSHARTFLNDVCTDIMDFRDQQLKYYRGDYDTFERVRMEADRLQQRQFEAQQMKREHVQKFIDRFRYKASKAASVQSRIKALEKLPQLEAVANDPSLCFTFDSPESLPTPVLELSSVWFSYDKTSGKKEDVNWILKDVDFSVDLQSRIAVCGVNGCGKSTLLRLLLGTEEPQKGFCKRANKLRIGFFSQYHVEQMDLTLSSVQQLQTKFPEADLKDEQARAYLGKFGISGLLALEPLYVLSGGQKSRVAIALMAFTNPHILVLDEPTNHLDLDAVQALIVGLNEFKGGIVVVSHDMHLLSCVADEIYHVDPTTQHIVSYSGDVESYRKDLLKKKI